MPRSLRLPCESDQAFRARAERAAFYARILADAALGNTCIKDFIANPDLPYSIESVRHDPTVRIEYEQALAIGDMGSCLSATKSKHWGDGPYVSPLEPEDPVDPFRILYVFKPGSLYNRRYEQRQRLKELLGRRYRPLVEMAKYKRWTKAIFLKELTDDQAQAIRCILHIEPGLFWRACRGKAFLDLPPREVQLDLPFAE